ncbi:MAG: hypothetical protein V3T83_02050 [Acidobacteriota bacterium]
MRGIEKALGKYASQVFTAQQAAALQAAGQQDVLPTGLAALDRLLGGGVARGSLTEIVGPASSGRTGLFFRLMAQATSRAELVACIDAFDSLDPLCAQSCGVRLERMLWVRCAGGSAEQSVARALKAADIVAQAGGFGVVALDLGFDCESWGDQPARIVRRPRGAPRQEYRESCEEAQQSGRRTRPPSGDANFRHQALEAVEIGSSAASQALTGIPSRSWFRLQRAVQGTPSLVLVLQSRSRAAGAASLVLSCQRKQCDWGGPQHPSLLRGISAEVELVRGRRRGKVRLQSRF